MHKISQTAIIFANGQPCSKALVDILLSQHTEAIKVVLDGAIEHIESYKIIPDVWLGDFDHRLDEKKFLEQYPNLNIIHTPDQEYTDLEKAISWLIENKVKTVIILWATGKRLDHTVNNVVNIARFNPVLDKIILYDDYSVCIPLPKFFEQYFTQGSVISLLPLGEVKGIVTENLKYPLCNESLRLGYRNGTSNEVLSDGIVRIRYTVGDLLLVLENKLLSQ